MSSPSHTILGLGGLLSDPACCVIKDAHIASAVEQAKVSRQDRPGAFPEEAFRICLEIANLKPEEIGCVAIARPFAPGPESPVQLELRARFPASDIIVVEHHHAHAASAYHLSAFQSASVLSVDRAGDFRSAVLFRGERNQLTPVRELYFPDSLGDLFNRVTALLGFEPRADEHKVQWLSAQGEPAHVDLFRAILHRGASAWPQLDRSFFEADRLTQGGFSARFFDAAKIDAAQPLSPSSKADIAASLQAAVCESVMRMLGPAENVCLAGGLALNARLVHALETHYAHAFVQPVAGNAGTALGAALYAWHNFYSEEARLPFDTLCLGPAYSAQQIKQVLENCKLRFRYLLTEGELIQLAVRALNDEKIIAWMQGRMEFGPRALGNRSILASPLNPYSSENLNVYIKHRESFRKFAASVPEELAADYFEVGSNARFLATVAKVRPPHRETFAPAILGHDLIRVHTVRRQENPLYHALLTAAGASTGLPVLYNTSFNLFGDPLVCTPRDAVRSFYSSGIDALFVGSFFLEK
ncbi:MAG TPA: carbamoyltransferase C-terminal domain-containing protein [Bryobacteraceae bacterium]|jgi:carbamoyltransferase|nr:carbamoyltransferase C-terminal domain-containing protein [Bryobacteraceae bacterium]